MGFIRGTLLFFVGLFLLVSLLVGNVLLTASMSLNYENVKPELTNTLKNTLQESGNLKEVENNFGVMQMHCQNNTDYVFQSSQIDYAFVIPCEVVNQGSQAVIDYSSEKFVEEMYYRSYDCDLFDCPLAEGGSLIFVSQHAQNYWKSKFYYSLAASLFLIFLMFLLVEEKKGVFINVGALVIVSALPLLFFNWLVSYFNFAGILFSSSKKVFWIMIILGGALIVFGFILRILSLGGGKFFSINEVKEIVKEEVSKNKGR